MRIVFYVVGATSASTLRLQRDVTWRSMDETTRAMYGAKYHSAMHDKFAHTAAKFPSDLTPVVRALKSALFSKRPNAKCAVGLGAPALLATQPLLPVWVSDYLVRLIGAASIDVAPNMTPPDNDS